MKQIIFGICIFFACLNASNLFAQIHSILIIQSYHPVLDWTRQCEIGIKHALGPDYEISVFYMDTKRIPESDFQKKADEAWRMYLKTKPELVMIGDDNGLRLLGNRLKQTDTPVVFFGINNNPRVYFSDQFPDNFTGVLERLPIFQWLRYLKKIIPESKKALFLMDSSPTTDAILNVSFQKDRIASLTGMFIEYKIAETWHEWRDIVTNSTAYDLIIMPTFHAVKDDNGLNISYEKVIEWTSANSLVPTFTYQDYTVGPRGVVGSYVIYGEAHGRVAGELVIEILEKGKSPSEIYPRGDREGKFYFNQLQLDRFNLTLPEEIKKAAEFK